MCLYLNDIKPKIAKRDIVCYKILNCTSRLNWDTHEAEKMYTTPYQNTPINSVNDDIIKGIRCFETNSSTPHILANSDLHYAKGFKWTMHGGCIHSYRYKKDADFMTIHSNFIKGHEEVIFKCVIPKGTEYYKGIDALGQENYASKKIRFVKQVK